MSREIRAAPGAPPLFYRVGKKVESRLPGPASMLPLCEFTELKAHFVDQVQHSGVVTIYDSLPPMGLTPHAQSLYQTIKCCPQAQLLDQSLSWVSTQNQDL